MKVDGEPGFPGIGRADEQYRGALWSSKQQWCDDLREKRKRKRGEEETRSKMIYALESSETDRCYGVVERPKTLPCHQKQRGREG